LAAAGFGSRRQCEELVEAGRVMVDGEVAKLGTTADPAASNILVDENPIRPAKHVYYAVNKPTGVVTTNRDPQGRPRVIDLVPPTERVFPVGRLDLSSEGLILLTNDGDLAQHLAHPKFGVRKVYRVTVAGKVQGETMRKMREGIYIAEGMVRVEGAKIIKARARVTDMEIVLREGKNREIRRILARLGHKVQRLRRIAIGPLRLGDIPAGAYRSLSREEVVKLRESTVEIDESADATRRGASKRSAKKKSGPRTKPSASRPYAPQRAAKGTAGKTAKAGRKTAKKRGPARDAAGPARAATSERAGSAGPRVGTVIGGDQPVAESRPRDEKKRVAKKRSAKKKVAKRTARGFGKGKPSGRKAGKPDRRG